MTLTEALKYHFLKYGKMTPQDTVKLIFQSEFGCGHMISDAESARRYLSRELSDTPRCGAISAVEPLGGKAVRLHLAALPESLSEETVFQIFYQSSMMFSGSDQSFERKLGFVLPLIEEKYAPFTRAEYMSYLERYFREGGGAVHHSVPYASAYRPAYRVIHADFAPFIDVFARIDHMLADGGRRFAVAIDGRCGAGKTTLASLLSRVYGCGVVHADDFYLPFRERHGQLGGLDSERMRAELSAGNDPFTYRAYDPHTDAFVRDENVAVSPFLIVEGSYSATVDSGLSYALKIFLTVDSAEQLRRIEYRSPDRLGDFKEKWIPAEERYFEEYSVAEKCDMVVKTDVF